MSGLSEEARRLIDAAKQREGERVRDLGPLRSAVMASASAAPPRTWMLKGLGATGLLVGAVLLAYVALSARATSAVPQTEVARGQGLATEVTGQRESTVQAEVIGPPASTTEAEVTRQRRESAAAPHRSAVKPKVPSPPGIASANAVQVASSRTGSAEQNGAVAATPATTKDDASETGHSTLAEELALLEQARAQLAARAYGPASATLAEHLERYPRSVLALERDLTRLQLQKAQGAGQEALCGSVDSLRANPSATAYRSQLDALCPK